MYTKKLVFKGKKKKIHIHQRTFKVVVGDPFAQYWCIDFGLLFLQKHIYFSHLLYPFGAPLRVLQQLSQHGVPALLFFGFLCAPALDREQASTTVYAHILCM